MKEKGLVYLSELSVPSLSGGHSFVLQPAAAAAIRLPLSLPPHLDGIDDLVVARAQVPHQLLVLRIVSHQTGDLI